VNLSAASVAAGSSVNVTDTTANIGSGPTLPASTTHYRLSSDSNITSADLLLGSRSVTILDGGTRSTGTVSVTIPSTVARGVYSLGACADGTNVVAESNEKNNCRGTPVTVQ
jgi:subtilase family serine protease